MLLQFYNSVNQFLLFVHLAYTKNSASHHMPFQFFNSVKHYILFVHLISNKSLELSYARSVLYSHQTIFSICTSSLYKNSVSHHMPFQLLNSVKQYILFVHLISTQSPELSYALSVLYSHQTIFPYLYI
jgi:hypothetical protein